MRPSNASKRIGAAASLAITAGSLLRAPDDVEAFFATAAVPSRAAAASSPRTPFALHSAAADTDSDAPVAAAAAPTSVRSNENVDDKHWEIGPTQNRPNPPPIPPDLLEAIRTNAHPAESQSNLGRGTFLTADWRRAWHTYQSPPDDPDLIDPHTGFAEYEITDVDGTVPTDLVGVLYRNGPGKFGVGGERVAHVLDSDGLIVQIIIPPASADELECSVDEKVKEDDEEGARMTTTDGEDGSEYRRKIMFRSRFVETEGFVKEREADQYVYRGTFGTGPRGFFDASPRRGLNADPSEPSLLSKIAGNALRTTIKNTANTQVISFGGKVLALFEAGLPYAIDPDTLETLGEDDMGGVLKEGKLPVKMGDDGVVPEDFQPKFIGGAAHTAHPNLCPETGHLVGWHWSQIMGGKDDRSLEVTFTEWSPDGFTPIAESTHRIPGCELAPHDMVLTENCIMLKVNALTMNQVPFLLGVKGPAASLEMDGRANVKVHVFPRPTAVEQFKPFSVDVPPCFSIHFSHGYEDPKTGHLVSFFSGWPPSDAKDFLGAWGGFAPNFADIPPTCIWRLEVDPDGRRCVDLSIAPGSANACAEHPLVHPNFSTRRAQYVYAVGSNVVGDSSAPCGYVKLRVEDGSTEVLPEGEFNSDIDAYWFGTRYFAGEPLIVPKRGGDPEREEEAYLLGMAQDSVRDRSFVAIFDLERELRDGPVCKLWLRSSVPHGLHGCFAEDGGGASSVFC